MNLKDHRLWQEHQKKLIPSEERKKLGIILAEEMDAKVEAKLERDLHNQIIQECNRRGIAYGHNRMDRKSGYTEGWPDFTFSVVIRLPSKDDPTAQVSYRIACAFECKIGNKGLDTKQEEVRQLMLTPPNSWYYKIIRSLQEFCDELKALGV